MSLQAQQGRAGGMPVLILKEGASQTKGRDAQKNNITGRKTDSGSSTFKFRSTRHGQNARGFSWRCDYHK